MDRLFALDGVRGIAALFILLYHVGQLLPDLHFVHRGYLAVDVFFVLSGFVLTQAFEAQLKSDPSFFPRFALLRIARFWPVLAVGVVIGAGYVVARDVAAGHALDAALHRVLDETAFSLAFVPNTVGPVFASAAPLFPLNGPLWTLCFELVINLLWGLWIVHWSIARLLLAALIFACGFLAAAIPVHSAAIGWNFDTAIAGFGRCGLGFVLGVLLYRGRRFLPKIGSFGAALGIPLMIAGFCWPRLAPETPMWAVAALDIGLAVLLPLLVIGLCARAALPTPIKSLARGLGDLSFPLYATHWPILFFIAAGFERLAPDAPIWIIAFVMLAVPLMVGMVVNGVIDHPVRRLIARYRLPRTAIA